MRSLQARLLVGQCLAVALLMALLFLIGGYSLRHMIELFVAERLEHDMDNLLTLLNFDAQGQPILDPTRLNSVFRQPYSGHYFKIQVAGHELRSRSLWDADLILPPTTNATATRTFTSGPQEQQLLLVARSFSLQGRAVTIAVTEDFTPLEAGLRQLLLGLALLALLLLALLLLVQAVIVRQGLKPLDSIRRNILRLAQGDIDRLDPQVPSELQPLVAEINRLIQVLSQRLHRSRHALGNLAHALKSPLTVLVQIAEQQPPAVRAELGQQTRQIQTLMQRELKRARIAGGGIPGQRVVLAHEVADLLAMLGKIYRDKDLIIEQRLPADSVFPGDRDDMLELLGNLLDNACQWARQRVWLSARLTGDRLSLLIEDDGPGCDADERERLTQRGIRIDEAKAGHGLGLAIVADIVEQYGGSLTLGRSAELGGFLAQVELPVTV